MPEDPVLDVIKSQIALQALLRELENLKTEVGKYSAASRALEPAADAVRAASGALSATSDRFTDYAKAVAATDLASVSEAMQTIGAELSAIQASIAGTQQVLDGATASITTLTETVLTRERLVEELAIVQKGVEAAASAAKERADQLAELVRSQWTAVAKSSTAEQGKTRDAIEKSTAGIEAAVHKAGSALSSKLNELQENLLAVQAAGSVLRVLGILGAVLALAAAVFSFLGWHR